MIAIRSAIVIASSWSCVTWMNVIPTSFWIAFSSSCICLRSFRSSAPSGSSSSSTRGLFTSARASATRCCWPPESCRGLRLSSPSRPTSLRMSSTRPRTSLAAHAAAAQAEGDVLEDRQVREERVRLEDRVHVALVGRPAADRLVAEVDRPLGRLLEAADHAQGRRLAAARGAEQREEAAALDLEREVVHGLDVVELLRHVVEPDVGGARGRLRLGLLGDRHQLTPTRSPFSTRAPQS